MPILMAPSLHGRPGNFKRICNAAAGRGERLRLFSQISLAIPSFCDKDGATMNDAGKAELLALLRSKSVFHGDFVLTSGARSHYYVDCKLTTFDAQGAWLVGEAMLHLIRSAERALNVQIAGVGGLTMGADPISLAVGMMSHRNGDPSPLKTFAVRKTQKGHGQARLIEGNFREGDLVAVIDDVITKGESTLKAIEAVAQSGGKIAFVAALVDREEGGRQRIEAQGRRVFPLFNKEDLLGSSAARSAKEGWSDE
jgi:orotate phosphoribosyltransferase